MSIIEAIRRIGRNYNRYTIPQEDIYQSVERSNKRGIYAAEYDHLGIAFGAIRLEKKMTVDDLSRATGVKSEDIIDLELAGFHLCDAVGIAAQLREGLGIKSEEYNKILASSTRKT